MVGEAAAVLMRDSRGPPRAIPATLAGYTQARLPSTTAVTRTGVLCAALIQWSDGDTAPDKAAARRAGSTAIDAIDALLRDLYALRGPRWAARLASPVNPLLRYLAGTRPSPASLDE